MLSTSVSPLLLLRDSSRKLFREAKQGGSCFIALQLSSLSSSSFDRADRSPGSSDRPSHRPQLVIIIAARQVAGTTEVWIERTQIWQR